jgi:hypothetical protein
MVNILGEYLSTIGIKKKNLPLLVSVFLKKRIGEKGMVLRQ